MYNAFSGGAQGADVTWQVEAKRIGLPMSFTHYRPEHIAGLSDANKLVVDKAIMQVCKDYGKLWPTNSLDLIRRNYLIAKACNKIWAIGNMLMEGDYAKTPYGGTSWGVKLAADMGKEVVFFDQLKEVWWWFNHQFLAWVPLDGVQDNHLEYLLTDKPGLIGTRNLSKAGKAAIQQVLTQTKERHATTVCNQNSL